MTNAEYTLKVINLLRREANAKAGISSDSRLGKSDLTVDRCEALEDELEAQMTRPMAGTEAVTDAGYALAQQIKANHFPSLAI